MSQANFGYRDYDGERGSTSINTVEITSANFDAQQTLVDDLRVAMNALTLEPSDRVVITDDVWNTLVFSTDPLAQREIKWAVIVSDGTTRYKANEIPIADLSILENNSKYIVKNGAVSVVGSATEVQAFITAYEAVARTRTGVALQVVDVYQVGRNT